MPPKERQAIWNNESEKGKVKKAGETPKGDKYDETDDEGLSAEIVIAFPDKKTSRKNILVLGLIDTGASADVISKDVVQHVGSQTMSTNNTTWDTMC